MQNVDIVKDKDFLLALDRETIKEYFVKIVVLDRILKDDGSYLTEVPIRDIAGRVTTGSITINGSSAIRRVANITFIAEETENDLTDIDNLLSINKKVKIYTGLKNTVDTIHPDIIWFNQGVYIITNPSISHTTSGVTISLQLKDKMCLLNGECGGELPAAAIFDSYDQYIDLREEEEFPTDYNDWSIYKVDNKYFRWDSLSGEWVELTETVAKSLVGTVESRPQCIFDIIQTLVCNYGGEAIERIIINDVPKRIHNAVRYIGSGTLYYDSTNEYYTLNPNDVIETQEETKAFKSFKYNEDCGNIFTDYVYPGTSLAASLGDSICSILDKIKSIGNYEYFYDVDGNFVFQEIKNYLNNSFDPIKKKQFYLMEDGQIISNETYTLDLSNTKSSIYSFEEGSPLVSTYSNVPSYTDVKNDFHIWGKTSEGLAIHYHIAIKDKPLPPYEARTVIFEKDTEGKYTGRIRLAEITPGGYNIYVDGSVIFIPEKVGYYEGDKAGYIDDGEYGLKENLILFYDSGDVHSYIPNDWRAELYIRGLEKQKSQIRPDIYEQELLDLFDSIYGFTDKLYYNEDEHKYMSCSFGQEVNIDGYVLVEGVIGAFKTDMVNTPNNLNYWFDYINPSELTNFSVDVIGTRIKTHQNDIIKRLYDYEVPNVIMINNDFNIKIQEMIEKEAEEKGFDSTSVNEDVYDQIALGSFGDSAQNVARGLMYQYITYNAAITLNCIPIYYLEPNNRISVYDKASGINGDYVINSINLPLDGKSMMSISAVKAISRV